MFLQAESSQSHIYLHYLYLYISIYNAKIKCGLFLSGNLYSVPMSVVAGVELCVALNSGATCWRRGSHITYGLY